MTKSGDAHNRPTSKTDFPTGGLSQILGSKYKLRILWNLQDQARRFGEIRKSLSAGGASKDVAPRVLGRELKSLVELGLIRRKAYNEIPPRVEYRLTALGRSLLLVISAIVEWSKSHPSRSRIMREALSILPDAAAASTSESPPQKKTDS